MLVSGHTRRWPNTVDCRGNGFFFFALRMPKSNCSACRGLILRFPSICQATAQSQTSTNFPFSGLLQPEALQHSHRPQSRHWPSGSGLTPVPLAAWLDSIFPAPGPGCQYVPVQLPSKSTNKIVPLHPARFGTKSRLTQLGPAFAAASSCNQALRTPGVRIQIQRSNTSVSKNIALE